MIVAVVALVAAVAGTAIAVPGPARKLDTKERKAIAMIARKQANKAISSKASGLSVKSAKTANSATTAATATSIAAGSVKAGSFGPINVRTNEVMIPNNSGNNVQVDCQPDERLLSGGTATSGVGAVDGWKLIRSGPLPNSNPISWDAAAHNSTGSAGTLIVKAVCLAP